ncbi:hypothetical protein N806_14330 [Rhodococcus sp. P27]|nr:hypothetical protein N806_14330 [Rhodococcus sp. P27]
MTAVLHPAPPHRPAPTAHRAEPSPSWFRTRRTGLALTILLAATAVLYLWNLTASGYANTFYAAAAQAGSQNWKAWFFGSLDTSNFITVDKPPASLWVMGLSGRIFGFSSASLLVPQALMGVGSVALVYAAVKRVATPAAGLVAGAVLAATPAAALMFKFDNPDALLVLLMTLAGYFVIRAMCTAVGRRAAMWVALAGVALGFAFLTKMLQGLMVLPAFGAAYLTAGQVRLRTRLFHLVIGAASVVISAGWWVLAVWLWPADSRPYIGGSTNNSVMDLVLGYNGLGRLFGNTGGGMSGGSSGMAGGSAGSSFGGSAGLDRLFGSEMGIQISWLIPAALIALVFGLLARGRAPRTDLLRASLILWGGWFLVTGLIFSYMSGTIHLLHSCAGACCCGDDRRRWIRPVVGACPLDRALRLGSDDAGRRNLELGVVAPQCRMAADAEVDSVGGHCRRRDPGSGGSQGSISQARCRWIDHRFVGRDNRFGVLRDCHCRNSAWWVHPDGRTNRRRVRLRNGRGRRHGWGPRAGRR